MFSLEETLAMDAKTFAEHWETGEIQDSCLKLIGARPLDEDDKK